ncbi:sugar ABC transporter ATP-binding protein [Salinisphaera hydrothermalis]|uniref:sugar ABC transporter ATP-binding protein n=1 Tax=Salinisphaera hydrothermalis TaxID=563188 RepID=UPI00333F1521
MLSVRDLSVRFGAVQALQGVSVDIEPGTIHALAGENGSGKSTLLKVLGGAQQPTSGEVRLNGERVVFSDPAKASRAGVGLIFQELSLFPTLSGYANIFIGHEPSRMGLMRLRQLANEADALRERLGFPAVDLSRPVAQLTVAEQQIVEILKCLSRSPKIILFDEPTASLTQKEVRPVLDTMRRLRDNGYTVIFVSHYLEEVFAVADRVTVLRDGQMTMDEQIANVDSEKVLAAMLGRTLTDFFPTAGGTTTSPDVFLRLDGITCPGLKPVDLEIRAGEILGVAGAVGSGSALLGEVLGGLRRPTGGRLRVGGEEVRLNSAARALKAGIAYVPEDRRTEALLQDLSSATNISLPLIAAPDSPLVHRSGFLRRRRERELIKHEMAHMGVRPGDPSLPARNLSGGNQQKLVLGRWFLYDRPCLILNNPTKGIDIGSKAEIYQHIRDLADSGHCIVFISNYNPELLGISDRIVVFREGRLVAMHNRGEADENLLLDQTMGDASVVDA